MTPRIHVGVGGWTFEPWRDNFYPAGLPHSQELRHASRRLTAIEVNGTFYSTFKPATFAKWRDETPDGFVFSLKAHRFTTHRRDLATAGEGIQRFVGSGIDALGDKLGPLLWQFMPTKAFDAGNVEAFLRLLPREVQGRPLRHVLDVRHPSFACEAYLDLLARHDCTTVYTDSEKFPAGLPAADAQRGGLRDRLPAGCAGAVGARRARVGRAGRAERGLRLLHQRGQGAGAARGDGVPAATGLRLTATAAGRRPPR